MRQPVLEVEDVSKVIVKHVLNGNSGQVMIPNRIGHASIIRGFPNWLQEYARNFISLDLKKVRDATDALAGNASN